MKARKRKAPKRKAHKARIMPDEFRVMLANVGLTQASVARFLDRDPRNCRRWASGDLGVPVEVVMLLALMIDHGRAPADVRRLAGLDENF